jgi:3-deoxy-D-manno-octulosonic acid kinase
MEIHPALGEDLKEALLGRPLEDYWREAEPFRGGRGTVRTLSLCGLPVMVKREVRGGFAGGLLPDLYLLSGPFKKEWALGQRLAAMDLAPQPLAQLLVRRGPLFSAYSMSAFLAQAFPLVQLWKEGRLGQPVLKAVGKGVGSLHRGGVLHGDLNAGNVLVVPGPWVYFLDFRHSLRYEAPPPAEGREANLLRLSRSLHKIHLRLGLPWPKGLWESLADGDGAGWGAREGWLNGWAQKSCRGFPLRRLLWKKRPDQDEATFPTRSEL